MLSVWSRPGFCRLVKSKTNLKKKAFKDKVGKGEQKAEELKNISSVALHVSHSLTKGGLTHVSDVSQLESQHINMDN